MLYGWRGGSSYLTSSATEVISTAGGNFADGSVSVDFVGPAVPETSTWTMLLIGFAGLGIVAHRTSRTPIARVR
jgi:hypothetical protein